MPFLGEHAVLAGTHKRKSLLMIILSGVLQPFLVSIKTKKLTSKAVYLFLGVFTELHVCFCHVPFSKFPLKFADSQVCVFTVNFIVLEQTGDKMKRKVCTC